MTDVSGGVAGRALEKSGEGGMAACGSVAGGVAEDLQENWRKDEKGTEEGWQKMARGVRGGV